MRGTYRGAAGLLLAAILVASSAAPASARIGVPTFTQRLPTWSHDRLGTDPTDTIGSAGCAITSVAMVQAGFGYSTNPQLLNRWLTQHGGYVDNDLVLWRQAMVATKGAVRWKWLHVPGIVPELRVDDQNIDDMPTESMVAGELDQNHLVVAEVRLNGNMHFVVITGRSGGTLFINDPWYGDRTTLQARYGDYAHAVRSAQIYYQP
jgi:hypothetical protein